MAFSCCGLVCEIGISLTTYYRRRRLDCGSQTLRRSRTGGLLARIARFRMAAAIPMAASAKTLTQNVLLGFAGIAITGRLGPSEGRFGLPTAPGGNTPPMPPTSAPG